MILAVREFCLNRMLPTCMAAALPLNFGQLATIITTDSESKYMLAHYQEMPLFPLAQQARPAVVGPRGPCGTKSATFRHGVLLEFSTREFFPYIN